MKFKKTGIMESHGFIPVVPTFMSFGATSRCLTIHRRVFTHGFLGIGIKLLLLTIITANFFACSKNEPMKASPPAVYVKKKTAENEAKKEPEKYVYNSENLRNPFIAPELRSSMSMKVGEIDISLLELKGIVAAAANKQKYALVAIKGGESYIIRNGKLMNMNNKVVPGVTGMIKGDEVILVTDKHYMRVLKIEIKKPAASAVYMEKVKQK